MIFPRVHQRKTVRELVSAAAVDGPDNNYLVEQSAGSGKSNTIAWLALRVSNLHNTSDERVFDSLVVMTDRVVLDRRLDAALDPGDLSPRMESAYMLSVRFAPLS